MKRLHLVLAFFMSLMASAQDCAIIERPETEFRYKVDPALVDAIWNADWKIQNGESLPKGLRSIQNWVHPFMNQRFSPCMHEDAFNSDVSNLPGPTPNHARAEYFHVLEKGAQFSGMCPAFNFIHEDTLVTLSFGRAKTTLLLLYVGDSIHLIDQLEVPGRGNTALELAGKKGRDRIFRNTSGGAYSYLSDEHEFIVPGANNIIIRIKIKYGEIDKKQIEVVDVRQQMMTGNSIDPSLTKKEKNNTLTAVNPDAQGNIWFTSQQGVIGLVHHSDKTEEGCPKVYATFIGFIAARQKIRALFGKDVMNDPNFPIDLDKTTISPEERKTFHDYFLFEKTRNEQIQNSFSMDDEGIYIVTNIALYKLYFDEQTKSIKLFEPWLENMVQGKLIYNNDWRVKPGHLNNGSGTSPTLMGDHVAICDNDTNQINICVFDKYFGELVFRHPLFTPGKSACENSIVAYNGSFVVANTYGYTDPFKLNDTEGGMNRFDLINGQFVKKEDWPPYMEPYDGKTATPKLCTQNGLIYVYNRFDDGPTEHADWRFTALDFETGKEVFSLKPYFEDGVFDDNIGGITKNGSLGKKNYDRKVMNNIWGTFTIGPNNSIYLGMYRGFLRLRSD